MLPQITTLLRLCAPDARRNDYRDAVVNDNALLKATATTRRKTFVVLGQLYGLDPSILVFRALRDLWDFDVQARPLLAILCGLARDPTLRATAEQVLSTPIGATVAIAQLSRNVACSFPDRFSAHSQRSIGANAASSWEQAGHLRGRVVKIRQQVSSCPTALAYALLLGHLCGDRHCHDVYLHRLTQLAGIPLAPTTICLSRAQLDHHLSAKRLLRSSNPLAGLGTRKPPQKTPD